MISRPVGSPCAGKCWQESWLAGSWLSLPRALFPEQLPGWGHAKQWSLLKTNTSQAVHRGRCKPHLALCWDRDLGPPLCPPIDSHPA